MIMLLCSYDLQSDLIIKFDFYKHKTFQSNFNIFSDDKLLFTDILHVSTSKSFVLVTFPQKFIVSSFMFDRGNVSRMFSLTYTYNETENVYMDNPYDPTPTVRCRSLCFFL